MDEEERVERMKDGTKATHAIERKILNGDVPVLEIEKGHCRTSVQKVDDGFVFVFCVSDKYCTPGENVTEPEERIPVFGLKLWGIEHFKIIAKCFMLAADHFEEQEGGKTVEG